MEEKNYEVGREEWSGPWDTIVLIEPRDHADDGGER